MSILYTSLVKLPEQITSVTDAISQIKRILKIPTALDDIRSDIILIDEWHINVVRKFDNVSQYKAWVFSNDRNMNDDILMQNGFYLYTKQAHNER
jgi:antibiotic biosynthesis monooxygenase (ABM) superfamily enzyme